MEDEKIGFEVGNSEVWILGTSVKTGILGLKVKNTDI